MTSKNCVPCPVCQSSRRKGKIFIGTKPAKDGRKEIWRTCRTCSGNGEVPVRRGK